jgi:hypothetical protein
MVYERLNLMDSIYSLRETEKNLERTAMITSFLHEKRTRDFPIMTNGSFLSSEIFGLRMYKCFAIKHLYVCVSLAGPQFVVTDTEVRTRFAALPDFLTNSGSGTGSTQPCEYN